MFFSFVFLLAIYNQFGPPYLNGITSSPFGKHEPGRCLLHCDYLTSAAFSSYWNALSYIRSFHSYGQCSIYAADMYTLMLVDEFTVRFENTTFFHKRGDEWVNAIHPMGLYTATISHNFTYSMFC